MIPRNKYFDMITNRKNKKHNPNWSQTLDQSSRILTTGSSKFEKTNSSLNLISQQPDVDKTFLYVKWSI